MENSGTLKFLLVESGILGFGIWNSTPGIRNPAIAIGIQNHSVHSRIEGSLGLLYRGRNEQKISRETRLAPQMCNKADFK